MGLELRHLELEEMKRNSMEVNKKHLKKNWENEEAAFQRNRALKWTLGWRDDEVAGFE